MFSLIIGCFIGGVLKYYNGIMVHVVAFHNSKSGQSKILVITYQLLHNLLISLRNVESQRVKSESSVLKFLHFTLHKIHLPCSDNSLLKTQVNCYLLIATCEDVL